MSGGIRMNISETIRTYRKERNMTQEQVANYLGVSAPAVNKWEKGISYPDITLLAPLARLLRINVDTLLSFHDELSENEIGQFINELSQDMLQLGFEKSFRIASDKIKEYPNCNKLILWTAQILNGYLVMKLQDVDDVEKYKKQIDTWLSTVAFCEEHELANAALMSLAGNLMNEKKYEEAQKLIDQIPPIGFDKRITQTQLYVLENKFDEAHKLLEETVYQHTNSIVNSLTHIITIYCKNKEYEKALQFAKVTSELASLFDLGSYAANSVYFIIYAEMGEKEKTIDALEQMMEGFETMGQPKSSALYQHMKFKEDEDLSKVKGLLMKAFDTDSEMDFIRDEPRYKKLVMRMMESK